MISIPRVADRDKIVPEGASVARCSIVPMGGRKVKKRWSQRVNVMVDFVVD